MSNYKELAELNVNDHTEQKGKFTYLSWAWAHDYLAKLDPDFSWELHEFSADSSGEVLWPYMSTPAGCFVKVSVTFKGKTIAHTYPVLNHQNKSIPSDSVTAFDINNAQMRGFAKCCALHGLGLYIFAGEDLPQAPDISDVPAHKVQVIGGKFDGFTLGEIATKAGLAGMGYLYWMASQKSKDPMMAAKAQEVWEAHKQPYTDAEVTDLLADADTVDDLNGLYRLLTDEQQTSFKDQFSAARADLETPTQRTADNARG